MERQAKKVESLVREGFDLLLQLRRHPDAQRLVSLTNAFMQTLLQSAEAAPPAVMVSVKAVPLRRL